MFRRCLLWFGILVIMIAVSLPLYVIFVFDFSDQEMRPVDVPVNVRGGRMRAEFTATRKTYYSVAISAEVPRGVSNDDAMHKYACMVRAPGCFWKNDQCRARGLMNVSRTVLNGTPARDASADCHYGITGYGDRKFAIRDLFTFDAEPGQHYVIKADVTFEDAVLAKLGPHLIADAPAIKSEEEGLTFLASLIGLLFGSLLGGACVIASRRWKRVSSGAA